MTNQAIDTARRAKDDAMACATRLRTEAHQHLCAGLLWQILAAVTAMVPKVTDLWMPLDIFLAVAALTEVIMSLFSLYRWNQADDRHKQSLERVDRTTRAWMERIDEANIKEMLS